MKTVADAGGPSYTRKLLHIGKFFFCDDLLRVSFTFTGSSKSSERITHPFNVLNNIIQLLADILEVTIEKCCDLLKNSLLKHAGQRLIRKRYHILLFFTIN